MALFCAATVVFLAYRDLTIPAVRDTEVWFGFEVHGTAARLSAPLHWAIFAVGAWAYWTVRPWVWPWAALYAATVPLSHVVWNFTSPNGGGAFDAAWQFALLSLPAFALWFAKPAAAGDA